MHMVGDSMLYADPNQFQKNQGGKPERKVTKDFKDYKDKERDIRDNRNRNLGPERKVIGSRWRDEKDKERKD